MTTSDHREPKLRGSIRKAAGEPRPAPTPAEAADLEILAAWIDGRRSMDDIDDATMERLIDAFGLDGLTDALER